MQSKTHIRLSYDRRCITLIQIVRSLKMLHTNIDLYRTHAETLLSHLLSQKIGGCLCAIWNSTRQKWKCLWFVYTQIQNQIQIQFHFFDVICKLLISPSEKNNARARAHTHTIYTSFGLFLVNSWTYATVH